MAKSPDAFRTISEVADLLDVPAHVLRFWESRFPQIRPVKRAGGRRYYRPTDVALLAGIRLLLHDRGLTIRGVQKILREQGMRHVCALADPGLASEAQQEWSEDDGLVLPPRAEEDRVIPWPGPRSPAPWPEAPAAEAVWSTGLQHDPGDPGGPEPVTALPVAPEGALRAGAGWPASAELPEVAADTASFPPEAGEPVVAGPSDSPLPGRDSASPPPDADWPDAAKPEDGMEPVPDAAMPFPEAGPASEEPAPVRSATDLPPSEPGEEEEDDGAFDVPLPEAPAPVTAEDAEREAPVQAVAERMPEAAIEPPALAEDPPLAAGAAMMESAEAPPAPEADPAADPAVAAGTALPEPAARPLALPSPEQERPAEPAPEPPPTGGSEPPSPFEGLPLFMQPPAPAPVVPEAEEKLHDLAALAGRLRGLAPDAAGRAALREAARRLRGLRDRIDRAHPPLE